MKYGVLGVGNIGGAIVPLISKLGEVVIYTTNSSHKNIYGKSYKLASSEEDLFSFCDIIFIAIKPQNLCELLSSKSFDLKGKCVISFCAGIDLAYLENKFRNAEIVRFMPNTAIKLGKSMTTASSNNLDKYTASVTSILNCFGYYRFVDEDTLNGLLPLNGSMPAFLYSFVKWFVEASEDFGIKNDDAIFAIASTLISSGEMILNNNNLDELIKNVSSKGGATIAGLTKLNNDEFISSIKECYKACYERNLELNAKK